MPMNRSTPPANVPRSASVQAKQPWWQQPLARRQADFPRRLFCQELAVLLDAGIPLFEAIATLREKESSPDVARVLSRLNMALSEGRPLAQAMREQPEAFSTLLIASIEASQRTGQTP